MDFFKILIVLLLTIILDKGLFLISILTFFAIKGRSFNFKTECWSKWLLELNPKKVKFMLMSAVIFSLSVSTFATYGLLFAFKFKDAFEISLLLSVFKLIIFLFRFNRLGKDYLKEQIEKIQNTIYKDK